MSRYRLKNFIILLLAAVLALTGCSPAGTQEEQAAAQKEDEQTVKEDEVEKESTQEGHLRDNMMLYSHDDDTSVVTMYLTVKTGNAADNTNHTWTEVNTHSAYYYEDNNLDRYNCEAILQVGNENGPAEGEFGYGETTANAAVQVRGQSSSKSEQKNYKIRIKDGKGSWRGQRSLALNKHVSDPVRFRNKFAYDMMKNIPQIISARTQFVHLYVKDETAGGNGTFTDYGLYTQVEQINKTYLKSHGLDNRGHLYKVNFFEWNQYEALRLKTDPEYDVKAFEELLEIKGNDDHQKLLDTIDAVNDYSMPTEELIETYFDSENICYWMAFQILIGNYDVGSRNSYLYSPLNSKKWYVIPWDNDASFTRNYYRDKEYSEGMSWEQGMTQFLHLSMLQRMFKEEKYRNELKAAVEDLRANYLTQEKVAQKMNAYAAVVKPYVMRAPDEEKKKLDSAEYDTLVSVMPSEIEENYGYFLESLEKPWAFFVSLPIIENGKMEVSWDAAYDVDHEEIVYTVILARDYNYTDIIAKQENIVIPGASFDKLPPGDYYLKVKARNESGYEQECYDYYSKPEGGGKAYGTVAFTIHDDGEITLKENEDV